MFTLLITASIGAYISRRSDFDLLEGTAGLVINYDRIWTDLIALLTFIGAICNWVIATGRKSRIYVDQAILPWLRDRGISVKLPVIDLPKLPTTAQLD